jgi:hypothetical protein
MRTKEQKQQETISYLRKTANHLFIKKDGTLYRIVEDESGKFWEMSNEVQSKNPIDLDFAFSYYSSDPKAFVKRRLFPQGHEMQSVKMKLLKKLQAAS